MNKQLVAKYISVIRRACDLLEQQLEEDVSRAFEEVVQQVAPPISEPVRATTPVPATTPAPATSAVPIVEHKPEPVPEEPQPVSTLTEDRLKHIDALFGIECWPPAIPQFQADAKPSEADYINRANALLDTSVGGSLEGRRVLDYGCGDGYVASQTVLRGPKSVLGYDVVPNEMWDRLATEQTNFTCDVNVLEHQGYDIILLYDVLDHCTDPVGVMKHIKYLCAPGALVYVRCHPWTSRHASHLPKFGLNKAYMHLFLNYEELVHKGFKPLYTRIEKDPIEAYNWWFTDFKIKKQRAHSEDVSEFFHVPAFKELLASEQGLKPEEIDAFLDRMRLQFVDYILEA